MHRSEIGLFQIFVPQGKPCEVHLLATAVPMKPFEPKTVTTSPEKEDLPPRPRFMEAVLRALPVLTWGARGVRRVCQAPGPS